MTHEQQLDKIAAIFEGIAFQDLTFAEQKIVKILCSGTSPRLSIDKSRFSQGVVTKVR